MHQQALHQLAQAKAEHSDELQRQAEMHQQEVAALKAQLEQAVEASGEQVQVRGGFGGVKGQGGGPAERLYSCSFPFNRWLHKTKQRGRNWA